MNAGVRAMVAPVGPEIACSGSGVQLHCTFSTEIAIFGGCRAATVTPVLAPGPLAVPGGWHDAAVSWSLLVVPLHHAASHGALTWIASATYTYGVPATAPEPQPFPLLGDVLAAFGAAGCHGTAWFTVDGVDQRSALAPCPDPAGCRAVAGLDLGEVTIDSADQADPAEPLRLDAAVDAVSFRAPVGVAALRAVCALTAAAGPLLVFDDVAERMVVVTPQDGPADLVGHWPW